MAPRDTKSILIEVGTRLFIERGYCATGLQDILREAGVPKGSFYHYFRSKEDFVLAVTAAYHEAMVRFIDDLMADTTRAPWARVRAFFEAAFSDFSAADCRYGCLMGNLGQELAEDSQPLRKAIHGYLEEWALHLAQAFVDAGKSSGDPASYTRFLIDGFQGAALRMKLERSPAPLERFMFYHFSNESAFSLARGLG